jgi:pimeloyl-ACP methyl ester carboxylesterase
MRRPLGRTGHAAIPDHQTNGQPDTQKPVDRSASSGAMPRRPEPPRSAPDSPFLATTSCQDWSLQTVIRHNPGRKPSHTRGVLHVTIARPQVAARRMFFMRSDDVTGSAESVRDDRPTVRILPATGRLTAVVVMLHGGQSRGIQPTTTRQLAYRRMVPIAHAVHRGVHRAGTAVWLLRNRVRGWNEPDQDAVRDARWVLGELRRHHPEAAIVLVGHSMGARAALRVADAPGVLAVARWRRGSSRTSRSLNSPAAPC